MALQRIRVSVLDQLAALAARDEHERRRAAEQRVAPPLLAALDALEQEAVGAAIDLAERRDRGVVVGEHLAVERHELAGLGERLELGPGRDDHRAPDLAGISPRSSRAWRRVVSLARSPASIRASS